MYGRNVLRAISYAPAAYLRPAGDARLQLVAQHGAGHRLAVLLVVRDRMRARAGHRHMPRQYVEELQVLVIVNAIGALTYRAINQRFYAIIKFRALDRAKGMS